MVTQPGRRLQEARARDKKKARRPGACPERRAMMNYPGDDLLFHTVTRAVPSAQEGLTSVFGMGTGVAPPLRSPGILESRSFYEMPTSGTGVPPPRRIPSD